MPARFSGVLLDLGGVVFVGDAPLPGSVAAVARLRAAGLGVRFLTNTTRGPRRLLREKLRRLGIETVASESSRPQAPHPAAVAMIGMAGILVRTGKYRIADETRSPWRRPMSATTWHRPWIGSCAQMHRTRNKVGGWTETRPVSLGLLPSGPDPVGEWNVHRQPPSVCVNQGRTPRNEFLASVDEAAP